MGGDWLEIKLFLNLPYVILSDQAALIEISVQVSFSFHVFEQFIIFAQLIMLSLTLLWRQCSKGFCSIFGSILTHQFCKVFARKARSHHPADAN